MELVGNFHYFISPAIYEFLELSDKRKEICLQILIINIKLPLIASVTMVIENSCQLFNLGRVASVLDSAVKIPGNVSHSIWKCLVIL